MNVHELYPDVEEGAAGYGDFNGDGFDDVVFTQPTASDSGLGINGRVTVLFGGNESFDSSTPVVLSGTQTSELFGSAIAIGSFLGNGMTQLVLSSPGFDNTSRIGEQNHGRVSMYEWNQTQFDLSGMQTGTTRKCLVQMSHS